MTSKKSAKRKKSDPPSEKNRRVLLNAVTKSISRSQSPPTSSPSSSSSTSSPPPSQPITYKFSTYVPHQKRAYRKGCTFEFKQTRVSERANDITTLPVGTSFATNSISSLLVPSSSSTTPPSSTFPNNSISMPLNAGNMSMNEYQPTLLAAVGFPNEQGSLSQMSSSQNASPSMQMSDLLQTFHPLFSPPSTPSHSPTNIPTSLNASMTDSSTDASSSLFIQQPPQFIPTVPHQQQAIPSQLAQPQLTGMLVTHHAQQQLQMQQLQQALLQASTQLQNSAPRPLYILREETLEALLQEGKNKQTNSQFFTKPSG